MKLPILALVVALSLTGCRQQENPAAPVVEAPGGPAVPLTDAARARLAEADAADGQVDHVVSKCVTCALAMKGKPIHAVAVEGYTFHLCAAGCQKIFAKDPGAALVKLAPAGK